MILIRVLDLASERGQRSRSWGALLLAACGDDGAAAASQGACATRPVRVVVSVGQWGDIVSDLGGACAQ